MPSMFRPHKFQFVAQPLHVRWREANNRRHVDKSFAEERSHDGTAKLNLPSYCFRIVVVFIGALPEPDDEPFMGKSEYKICISFSTVYPTSRNAGKLVLRRKTHFHGVIKPEAGFLVICNKREIFQFRRKLGNANGCYQ